MRRVDHLHRGRSTATGKLAEQPFPDATLGPSHEAIVDRRRWTILRWAIAPSATALKHMQDAADHPPVIDPILAAHIRRQKSLDLLPLFVAQPEQVPSHDSPLL